MMKRLTANAGIASVIHSPIAKNSRKMTYTWESVKPGSLSRKVNPREMTRDITKDRMDFFRFESVFSIFVYVKLFLADLRRFSRRFAQNLKSYLHPSA